ncbi:MAG: major capsid protein, partial [Treponema sp.]|nr:major capsid protein [Treponema sp.]
MIKQFGRLTPFFSQASIADIVGELPKPLTPMTDLLFPPSARKQKQSPFISVEEVKTETGAIPLIRRGSASYPVDTTETTRTLIEVDPVSPSVFVSAKDVNDLVALGETESVKAFIAEKIELLRDRVSQTIETMSRQSLSGKINYPYAAADGIGGSCEIELGTPTVLKPVNLAGAGIPGIQVWLEELWQAQAATGASGDVVFLTGSALYSLLVNKFVAAKVSAPVAWHPDGMTLFGKYKIQAQGLTYTLPGGKTVYKALEDNQVLALDKSQTGKLFFAALDDLDANLAALPFYAKPVETKDPDGVKIVASSKPLPAPAL